MCLGDVKTNQCDTRQFIHRIFSWNMRSARFLLTYLSTQKQMIISSSFVINSLVSTGKTSLLTPQKGTYFESIFRVRNGAQLYEPNFFSNAEVINLLALFIQGSRWHLFLMLAVQVSPGGVNINLQEAKFGDRHLRAAGKLLHSRSHCRLSLLAGGTLAPEKPRWFW